MTDVTIQNEIINVELSDVQGPQGPRGEPGPTGSDGATQTVSTVAVFEASLFESSTKSALILGYYTVGVGQLNVRRVPSEPSHPWKFRSADRYLADGTEDLTYGGWWEGYSEGSYFYADSFGFVSDGLTDNSAAWTTWHEYIWPSDYSRDPLSGATLRFSSGTYYFASTISINCQMILEGGGSYAQTGFGSRPTLEFAEGIGGIVVNPTNADGPNLRAYPYFPGGSGTVIRGLKIIQRGTVKTPFKPLCYGIWLKARARIELCRVENWQNHGIAVIASGGAGNWTEGIANGWDVSKTTVANCCGAGLFIRGSDTNAGKSDSIDVDSCFSGIVDDSFLGNVHISPQVANIGLDYLFTNYSSAVASVVYYNGHYYVFQDDASTNAIRDGQTMPPSGTTADQWPWAYIASGAITSESVTWGRVVDDDGLWYDVVPGQEANMWTDKPSTNPVTWGTGYSPLSPAVGGIAFPWAQSAAMATLTGVYANYASVDNVAVGPYVNRNSYRLGGINQSGGVYIPYTEGGSAASCVFGKNVVIGEGIYLGPYSEKLKFYSALGKMKFGGEVEISSGDGRYLRLGVGDATYPHVFRYTTTNFPSGISLGPVHAREEDFWFSYSGAYEYIAFTGPSTAATFGRSSPVPYATYIDQLFLGPGRQITSATSVPGSGEWAKGDYVINSNPTDASGSQVIGWICTASGTPGTWRSVTATLS